MDFEVIAEFTRISARLSLVLFALAFTFEALRDGKSRIRLLWGSFIFAHAVHLGSLVFYFNALGESPKLEPVLILLVVGVFALVWMTVILLKNNTAKNQLYITPIIGWYLWFLFTATHITRLLDIETAAAINWILLFVMLSAGGLRVKFTRQHKFEVT